MFFATQAITVLHWSRLSDVVGRKPIILVGLFGLSLSMFSFGLSTTYWGAVFWYVSVSKNRSPGPFLITYLAGVLTEPSTGTSALSKVLLRRLPTLRTSHRFTRIYQLRGL